jgi:hypothetical protein
VSNEVKMMSVALLLLLLLLPQLKRKSARIYIGIAENRLFIFYAVEKK